MADAQTAVEREPDGWRPIATAPTDGTEILVYREDAGVFMASWRPCEVSGDCFLFSLYGEDLTGDMPTHWMPLPTFGTPPAVVDTTPEAKVKKCRCGHDPFFDHFTNYRKPDHPRMCRLCPCENAIVDSDEIPHGSCLICGYDKPYAAWHMSCVAGVCMECREKARAQFSPGTMQKDVPDTIKQDAKTMVDYTTCEKCGTKWTGSVSECPACILGTPPSEVGIMSAQEDDGSLVEKES